MIKVIVLIVLFFNILACGPTPQTANIHDNTLKIGFVCLKNQSQCDVTTPYGRFFIEFSGVALQTYIKTELPFQIQLRFEPVNEAYQLKSISSYLEGKSMFMGKIPVFFEKNSIQSNSIQDNRVENNTMVAESLLASCTEDIMTWRLWFKVEILADDVLQQQDFFIEFDSERL